MFNESSQFYLAVLGKLNLIVWLEPIRRNLRGPQQGNHYPYADQPAPILLLENHSFRSNKADGCRLIGQMMTGLSDFNKGEE